ncbi:MAG: hypothetical protein IPM92_14375 [Saprospiraceae bacterium]|nr:hypothetical protein [Saprospiraceae bacterium]
MAKQNLKKKDVKHVETEVKIPGVKLKDVFDRSKHSEMLLKLRPDLTRDLEHILNHEEQIMKALKSEKEKLIFMKNPIQFFKNAKIDLNFSMKQKMEAFNYDDFSKSNSFVLPNGQTISPNIKISIKNT